MAGGACGIPLALTQVLLLTVVTLETSQVYYHTVREDFTRNRLHAGISMRFETCEVRVRLFKCVSPIIDTKAAPEFTTA